MRKPAQWATVRARFQRRPMLQPSPAVALEKVTVAFGAGPARYVAVQSVDLAFAAGEFVAIVGPTGCGKSTLLNVVAGLLKPAGGCAYVHGEPVAGITRSAGYLFQQDALMPWKTAVAPPRASRSRMVSIWSPSVSAPRRSFAACGTVLPLSRGSALQLAMTA